MNIEKGVRDFREDKKAQVSMEFLIITGIILLILMPTIYLFYIQLNTMRSTAATKDFQVAINKINSLIDEVCYMGPGAKREIYIDFPQGFSPLVVENSNIVIYEFNDSENYAQISEKLPCNVSINLTRTFGLTKIVAINLGGIVNVTYS